jgi:arylsulfatase A-like enzyme
MRRVFLLFAVGLAVTFGAVVMVIHLSTRENSPTIHADAGQLQTDERAVLCDFSLDLDHEIQGLWALASQSCTPESGWSRLNRKGLLASVRGANLDVVLDSTDWTRFLMRISGASDVRGTGRVEVRLNGALLGSADLLPGWHNVGFPIPTELLVQGVNRFTFGITGFEPAEESDRQSTRSKHVFHLIRMALTTPRGSAPLSAEAVHNFTNWNREDVSQRADPFFEPDETLSTSSVVDQTLAISARQGQPDIVLITLDAARRDHFSCYGYGRHTTPNIDRFAEESLVFTNAFALVPNTRQSVPTMVTGLSFINHQVITKELMLADEATTLAEHLKGADYRTACFSATPNNSRSLATDQGYDEFFELWTETSKEESIDPHVLSARVVDWLEQNQTTEPLHLQLHFVPPHAPYRPAPPYDLFTNPDYEGPFNGFPGSILRSKEGRREPSITNLEHVIGSYDGNLRAADDAVARVLTALQKRPNWSNTVVLVTSDHGEAFFEHRRMGHNNTVYDEMLRVPLILRLPRRMATARIGLDRLATLADIVPTLLAAASLQPGVPLDGINLLAEYRPTNGADERTFAAKTAHNRPTRCLRSSRWKVIISNSGRGEFYDLENDPQERTNLSFSNRPSFLEKGRLLTRRFLSAPLLPKRIQETVVTERDREMLKALGYMD